MSSKEIVKLLRRCMFSDTLLKMAADKIEELESEITRQQTEIERLEKVLNGRDQLVNALNKCYNQAKSEAIKEFAHRLKYKIKTECNPYGKPTFDYDTSISIMRYIDNLVKEMVGGEK